MNNQHPITPPLELVQQWRNSWHPAHGEFAIHIATQAARWGADQELEACLTWVEANFGQLPTHNLRQFRRPKPPSLKEQALATLQKLSASGYPCNFQEDADWDTIRRALEQLDD